VKCFQGRNPFSVKISMQGLDKKRNHPSIRVRTHTGIYLEGHAVIPCHV